MYLFAILIVIVVVIALLRMNNLPSAQIDENSQIHEDIQTGSKRNQGWFDYSGNINDVGDSGGYNGDGGDGFDGGSSDGGGDSSSGF